MYARCSSLIRWAHAFPPATLKLVRLYVVMEMRTRTKRKRGRRDKQQRAKADVQTSQRWLLKDAAHVVQSLRDQAAEACSVRELGRLLGRDMEKELWRMDVRSR